MRRPRLRTALLLLPVLLSALVPAALVRPAFAGDRRLDGLPPPSQREVVDRILLILNRPEFEGSDEEEEGLLLILANFLSDIVDRVKLLRKTDPVVYATLVTWIVLTVLAIVAHVAWTVWRGGASGRLGRGGANPLLDPALATRAGRDPTGMLARADGAAAAGRFGEAAAWLYLSLLFRFEREGRVLFDPARTGLEYADQLALRPGDRLHWLGFLDGHDPVVFGTRTCTEREFAALRERATASLPPPAGEGRAA